MKKTSITQLVLYKFLTGIHQLWDVAAVRILRSSDPIVSLVFSLLSGGKCDKVAFSFPSSMFDCLCSRPVGLLLPLGGNFGHTGDCFTRGYRKVRSKINEETALLL